MASTIRASIGIIGGSRPERRGVGGQAVAVLGAADLAAGVGRDLQQADLAHAVEVRPDGVRVQAEQLGDLGRDQRSG